MALNVNVSVKVQSSAPGELIELFRLDLTPVNAAAGVLYFYPGSKEGQPLGKVTWLGNQYTPLPMSFDGADVTGKGSIPRPILTIANIVGTISGIINLWGDVRGSILTRWETFSDYLDSGPTPDSSAYLPLDSWKLDRIAKLNSIEAQIECRSYFDFQGVKLPRRQVLRNYCNLFYRVYNTTTHVFDYSHATCPYTGTALFDATGAAISDPALDVCSQALASGCLKRFVNVPVPFGGFPGAGQFTS